MKINEIKNSISDLPGIGKKTAQLFARLNLFTVGDLLQFYPRTYDDRTKKIPLKDASRFPKVHTIAQVTRHQWFGYGRMKTLKILISDGTAEAELVAFNRPFLEKNLPQGTIIAVNGRFETKFGKLQSTIFETQKIAEGGNLSDYAGILPPDSRIFPVYSLTEGLSQKILRKSVNFALSQFAFALEDELPEYLLQQNKLLHKRDAIKKIHNPQNLAEYTEARKALVYEEFFFFQCAIARQSIQHRGFLPSLELNSQNLIPPEGQKPQSNPPVSQEEFLKSLSPRQKNYLQRLQFDPTPDQKTVIFRMNCEIDKSYETSPISAKKQTDSKKQYSLRSLLQGDVGSGKTLVSFFAILRVIDYGSQAALMAPTEILARQHAESAAKELEALNVSVAYLTGNINAKGRLQLLAALKEGRINLVAGTHALFSKNVQYNDLALAIIDEQHRFGVMQRSAILDKARTSISPKLSEPNLLMMSATPIPQTLALTAFGDLDILTIRTLPPGRKPIQTYLTKEGNESNAYEAVRKELQKGHQAYFVYPAIGLSPLSAPSGQSNLSGTTDFSARPEDFFSPEEAAATPENLQDEPQKAQGQTMKSAEAAFSFLQNQVYPEYRCALIHGKTPEDEQAKILEEFKNGKINILVATTVVEVGVNVPNASCMVIEQADRFGLAALHQLRGRVGRGSDQSYCFLIYSKNITENGTARMKAIRQTTDGFAIAEEDLKLRGPGEITGTAQSGELTFALADLFKDQNLMTRARADAFRYVQAVTRTDTSH